jgi:hypothetical protein
MPIKSKHPFVTGEKKKKFCDACPVPMFTVMGNRARYRLTELYDTRNNQNRKGMHRIRHSIPVVFIMRTDITMRSVPFFIRLRNSSQVICAAAQPATQIRTTNARIVGIMTVWKHMIRKIVHAGFIECLFCSAMLSAWACSPFIRICMIHALRSERKTKPIAFEMNVVNFLQSFGSIWVAHSAHDEYCAAPQQARTLHHVAFSFR